MKALIGILYKPYLTFLLCLVFLTINLIFRGTLFQVFKLNQDLKIVKNRIVFLEKQNKKIKEKIKLSQDLDFIEKELRDRLDYTEEDDLIFIFPEKI
ncbi:MAG: septum formation initiator family protein [Bdellovibrionales bacterium]|nr:septum formation initiator family protein [Bdellovibrionales bacterium]